MTRRPFPSRGLRRERRIAGTHVNLDALFEGRFDPLPDRPFGAAFEAYRTRVPKPSGWWDAVDGYACEGAPRAGSPSIVFALPTRNRLGTSRAVEALRKVCAGAFFVVFHNHTQPPHEAVANDLARLRDAGDVLLIDRRVEADMPIGEIRGFVVDVALALCSLVGEAPIGSADSDIAGFLDDATYARVRAALASREAPTITTHRRYAELESLAPDVNLLLLGIFDNLRAHVRAFDMGAPAATVGAASVFDAAALCRVGGIAPLSIGEDLVMEDAFHRYRGDAAAVCTIQENGVFVDHRAQYHDPAGHYERWEQAVEYAPRSLRETTCRALIRPFSCAAPWPSCSSRRGRSPAGGAATTASSETPPSISAASRRAPRDSSA